ncbi:MAG: hypothetical protein NVS3B1_30040 [Marmoricola sp.]
MANLHNPTDTKLFCHRLQRILEAGEKVEITDEEATDLKDGQVFVVDADDSASESEDAPKRETAKRGTKAAGVTSTPDMETRG